MKFFKYLLFFISYIFILQSCARKGTPGGGPKDEDAPIMVVAKPAYESINFKGNSIRIYFDEYIVLKDLNKKLIISPPFKNPALITPQGTPSKYINIKILDTLKENTTYTFNFGDAIQDNNENNKLENFKYVFSTGNFIDSLTLKGSVIDVLAKKKEKNYNVLLYKIDSTYNDSIIYKKKPDYVTKTLDSVNFNFSNISEGKYRVFALEEETSNYLFNSKTDRIGFFDKEITLPKDSIIDSPITLFSEDQPYEFKRGKEIKKGKIQFGFTGKQEDIKVEMLSSVPSDFKSYYKLNKEKDSLNFWHTPVDLDSLNFIVTNKDNIDTTKVFLRKKQIDSLSVSTNIKSRSLHFKDTLTISTNTPIIDYDLEKFNLTVSDSIDLDFEVKKLAFDKLGVFFDMKTQSKYRLKLLPKAIKDLYNTQTKDTLNYLFITKQVEDYGSIIMDIQKEVEKPVIIELLANDKVEQRVYLTSSQKVEFTLLDPKKYTIKAIVDENENGVWDTGDYLLKRQPEEIIYFPQELELRANWILNEVMRIKKESP
ncbi:Ig-like domain-containing protein [Tenacibaculum skagerrakense]|uniref:Ig-like domain-containing protein n=1 Tax=Tenacibaculum skagerrakense TaxID=186571 RepID=A0A4R2NPU2_9FLAO|nr:Ig-like domain-containing protein [Tenacibaculum skagerrakense]TCP23849.1 Ig-like domain-containing protein [Tenacibaculum skagerrakense]